MKTAATSLGWRPMARSARSSTSSTRSAGCSLLGGCCAMRMSMQLDPMDQRGCQQVVLAREVAVDRAHGDVGARRHVAHLHRLVTSVVTERHRRVDDALPPGLLGAGERAGQRLVHRDIVSALPPGSSWTAATLGRHVRRGARARHHRFVERRAPGGRRDDGRSRPGGAGSPDPSAAVGRDGRAAQHHLVALGQGDRHRAAGTYVAGDVLSVLRQRRAGHPSPGRGNGRGGGGAGPVGGRRLVGRGQLGHRARGHRGLPRLLGGQPRRLPGGRPGDRGRRHAVARHPGSGAQRRHASRWPT